MQDRTQQHHALWPQALAAAGKLQNLTVANLQLCLDLYGLPKSGNKSQLVERLSEHLRRH